MMKGTGILLGDGSRRPVSTAIKAIVYDPNHLSLTGLASILQNEATIQVLGQFSDMEDFTDAAGGSSADVILVCIDNLSTPKIKKIIGGLATERGCPPPYMAAMSMSATGAAHFEALKVGARGVILKSYSTNRLVNAITTVADGGIVLPAAMARVLLERFIPDETNPFGEMVNGDISLTSRQRAVLAQVARGSTSLP